MRACWSQTWGHCHGCATVALNPEPSANIGADMFKLFAHSHTYNMLEHDILYNIILLYNVISNDMILYDMLWCYVISCDIWLYFLNMVLLYTINYNILQYMLYYIIL